MNDWKPWIDLVIKDKVYQNLNDSSLSQRQRRLVALALAVAKWHPDNPILDKTSMSCGLCALIILAAGRCGSCPIKIKCFQEESLYKKWELNKCKETEDAMHKMLMDLYINEYGREDEK